MAAHGKQMSSEPKLKQRLTLVLPQQSHIVTKSGPCALGSQPPFCTTFITSAAVMRLGGGIRGGCGVAQVVERDGTVVELVRCGDVKKGFVG